MFAEEFTYEFDVRGYAILRNVVPPSLLRRVSGVMSDVSASVTGHHSHAGFPSNSKFLNEDPSLHAPVDVRTEELLLWDTSIAELILLGAIHRSLEGLLGKAYRLDHAYAIFMRPDHPFNGTQALHNGGVPAEPAHRYAYRDGAFDLGLLTVLFAITPAARGNGGFCCIPGSHKSNLPLPQGASDLTDPHPLVEQPVLAAGDALIFTEAMTHGTLRWEAEHERQAILFKLMPGHMQWSETTPQCPPDADGALRALLRPSFRSGR